MSQYTNIIPKSVLEESLNLITQSTSAKKQWELSGNGSTTVFSINDVLPSSDSDDYIVFVGTGKISSDDFFVTQSTSTSTITFTTAPQNGSEIIIMYFGAKVLGFDTNNAISDSLTTNNSTTAASSKAVYDLNNKFSNYVLKSGDSISGNLSVSGSLTKSGHNVLTENDLYTNNPPQRWEFTTSGLTTYNFPNDAVLNTNNSSDYVVFLGAGLLSTTEYTIDSVNKKITLLLSGFESGLPLTVIYIKNGIFRPSTVNITTNTLSSNQNASVSYSNGTFRFSIPKGVSASLVNDTSSTSKTINAVADTYYTFGTLTSLNVTFPSSGTSYQEIRIIWTSGSTATSLNLNTTYILSQTLLPSINSVCKLTAVWDSAINKWLVELSQYPIN